MGSQKKGLHFSENNWSLFKLACNKPCCDSGDAIYYCATCSEDPGSTYAVKKVIWPRGHLVQDLPLDQNLRAEGFGFYIRDGDVHVGF
ncbi:hypothetical protein E2I00_006969 [Balaenoptera physalus]|uniref:Uncharacterized protein n=1 Tax=Balaenoptera physalus TaxID=9770 RepID=A0A6A1QDC4_BALPH|nr:hypothetical protein E2I00_006969 [Balaenoptera physalus]